MAMGTDNSLRLAACRIYPNKSGRRPAAKDAVDMITVIMRVNRPQKFREKQNYRDHGR
jgi:hypothetical protein